jgi:hypothetical protein
MKTILNIILLGIILSTAGCASNDKKNNDNIYDIESVNNKKWKVVKYMMTHIRNIELEITYFTDTSSYTKLSENLDKHIDLLISNCTMTGQAHDELHKWLLPFIDLVNELNNSTSKEITFKKLEQSFVVFNEYFN